MSVLVRFAPSPTGLLHIGNIRAALYNYLFARHHNGDFMLRLDDTDQVRSTQHFADAIFRDLSWLGIKWTKFAKQSERYDRYAEVLQQLIAKGRAYPCFETQEELDLRRKTQLSRGLPPVYDRAALKLTEAERNKFVAEGRKPYWRFKLNHADVVWEDKIQGHKALPASSLSDPVLMRDDGVPLYTYCSMVDDIDFAVTHIIRGEDHVTNTAVQIQIWQAITDAPPPVFAHFPLLVSSTGQEMSKRLGTLSIASMRDEMSIEPMAINSLLAKLGTSDPIAPRLSMDELAAEFSLDKVSRSTPKFDLEELKHLSAKILHITPFANVQPHLAKMGLTAIHEIFWEAAKHNLENLEQIRQWWQVATGPITPTITEADFVAEAASLLPTGEWGANTWAEWTNAVKQKTGRKGKELFMPLRLAITGTDHGPELKILLPIIGREKTLARLSGQNA